MRFTSTIREYRIIERTLIALGMVVLAVMVLFFGGYLYGAATTVELDPPLSAGTALVTRFWYLLVIIGIVGYYQSGKHIS